jgi:hypothetical protein
MVQELTDSDPHHPGEQYSRLAPYQGVGRTMRAETCCDGLLLQLRWVGFGHALKRAASVRQMSNLRSPTSSTTETRR